MSPPKTAPNQILFLLSPRNNDSSKNKEKPETFVEYNQF